MGCHFFLQGIFPTQELDLHLLWLLHSKQIFYLLSYRGSPLRRAVCVLSLTPCDMMDCSPPGPSVHGDSPGMNTGVGCHTLLQGIFPTQGSNPGLPHCRWIFYHLSHQGNPRILEWIDYRFSSGSFRPRNQTGERNQSLHCRLIRYQLS